MLKVVLFVSSVFITCSISGHPTGNMITVGQAVLWSYINPVDDLQHHACVMIWVENSDPRVWITSWYEASDYMLSNQEGDIYLIERRYIQDTEKFEARILKAEIDKEPEEIWGWFEDQWRLGEAGFFMLSDEQMVFGKYPGIYSLKKGETPKKYFNFASSINRIRAVENNQILLLGKDTCWLVERNGAVVRKWADLIDEQVTNSPLNRNQIFDADYQDGDLLLAYWGKRSFVIVDENRSTNTILQLSQPLASHWVAFYGKDKLLFLPKLNLTEKLPNLTWCYINRTMKK